jgi:MFS transporter, ACS family, aldohexuronate transporter
MVKKDARDVRWWIAGMLFIATVMNYMDRQVFSILARDIQNTLSINDLGYAAIVQAFLVAYTFAYLFAGRVTDWLGTKLSMVAFITWWSIADMLSAVARTAFSLGFFRFLLGLAEPGNYTAYSKAVAEWFPPEERGLAFGICTAGATVGATIAIPIVAYIGTKYGWRPAFILTGTVGLIWVIPWLMLCRRAEGQGPPNGANPRPAATVSTSDPPAPTPRWSRREWQLWKTLLTRNDTWLLLLSRSITDPVWYFYLFWFPKYLMDSRHLKLLEVGKIAWVVYAAADIGTLSGGWLSGLFVKRGMTAVSARKKTMLIAGLIVPLSPLVALAPSIWLALVVASIVVLAQLAWQVSLGTLIVDVFPQRLVATVFGIIAAGSGLGGFLSTEAIGHLVTRFSYTPVFVFMALLHPSALMLIWKVRDPVRGG